MLDSLEIPLASVQGMPALSSNAQQPSFVRKSVIPLPPEIRPTPTLQENPDDADGVFMEASILLKQRKARNRKKGRKQVNDSVSPQTHYGLVGGVTCFLDENAGLDRLSDAVSRRAIAP